MRYSEFDGIDQKKKENLTMRISERVRMALLYAVLIALVVFLPPSCEQIAKWRSQPQPIDNQQAPNQVDTAR